eukprot:g4477.t1
MYVESAYDPEFPPQGLYLVRIWDIGVDVLGPTTWTGHVTLNKTGVDSYTGTWLEYNDHFSAFYSSSTKLLSGAWHSEGDGLWGAINFHWNGVILTGRWTWYGRDGNGFEIWYPVDDDYELPAALASQVAPDAIE